MSRAMSWGFVAKKLGSRAKSVLICVGCLAIFSCEGHEGNQAYSSAQTGTDMLAFTAGMAGAAAVIKAGSTLDTIVVETLTNPKADLHKKKTVRRLNRLYSLAKVGAILGIAKGACACMNQTNREADKQGLAYCATLVITPILVSLWRTARW